MWLFVPKPLLNVKNIINGHSLYVLYDILYPYNQCFRVKVPFITLMWLLTTISHIAPKQICWPMFYLDTTLCIDEKMGGHAPPHWGGSSKFEGGGLSQYLGGAWGAYNAVEKYLWRSSFDRIVASCKPARLLIY